MEWIVGIGDVYRQYLPIRPIRIIPKILLLTNSKEAFVNGKTGQDAAGGASE